VSDRVRLDLGLLLPARRDYDECVSRLEHLLRATTGITAAHVLDPDVPEAAALCLHFDPAVFSMAEVERVARSVGAQVCSEESTRTRSERP